MPCLLYTSYARTIERPRFWSLNPQRFQISDYTYQAGNPELDPAYKQDVYKRQVPRHAIRVVSRDAVSCCARLGMLCAAVLCTFRRCV